MASLGIVPHAGYIVSAFVLSGTLSGELAVGVPPRGTVDSAGAARNNGYFGLNKAYPGDIRFANLDGVQAFEVSLAAADTCPVPGGGMGIDIWGLLSADADYTFYSWIDDGTWYESRAPSYASLAVSDARLTVHWEVAPIPEPQSWAMLAAGLLSLAGWRATARQHAR